MTYINDKFSKLYVPILSFLIELLNKIQIVSYFEVFCANFLKLSDSLHLHQIKILDVHFGMLVTKVEWFWDIVVWGEFA